MYLLHHTAEVHAHYSQLICSHESTSNLKQIIGISPIFVRVEENEIVHSLLSHGGPKIGFTLSTTENILSVVEVVIGTVRYNNNKR